MTIQQKESITRLKELVELRKRKNNITYDNCICSTLDLDAALILIQEQQIELEKNREIKQRDIDNQMQELFQQSVKIMEKDNKIKDQEELIKYILNEQIQDGFLVNFNTVDDAIKYYERKMKKRQFMIAIKK